MPAWNSVEPEFWNPSFAPAQCPGVTLTLTPFLGYGTWLLGAGTDLCPCFSPTPWHHVSAVFDFHQAVDGLQEVQRQVQEGKK